MQSRLTNERKFRSWRRKEWRTKNNGAAAGQEEREHAENLCLGRSQCLWCFYSAILGHGHNLTEGLQVNFSVPTFCKLGLIEVLIGQRQTGT